jgi:hypothetical protein
LFVFFFPFSQAREAAKSALVLFHEGMGVFSSLRWKESFPLFERAAAKGHEESIWITSVVKDLELEESVLRQAFAKTEEPLGWCLAGRLSKWGREKFDFYKKSAQAGCSWGQVTYARYFRYGGGFAEKDEKVYVEWLEKAANHNNPLAMKLLGDCFRFHGGFKEKAVAYYRRGAELGWKPSMKRLAEMLRGGVGYEKDLRQAVIWSAKGNAADLFWEVLEDIRLAFENGTIEYLDCDFDQLCYLLGSGLFWHQYEREALRPDVQNVFGNRCLDYYCSCIELQQKSIFAFLLCWNQSIGIKGPGQMIAQMVWEHREDNLVGTFEEIEGEEPETSSE